MLVIYANCDGCVPGGRDINEPPGSPEQFAAHIKSEIARFGRIAKAAGIKAE